MSEQTRQTVEQHLQTVGESKPVPRVADETGVPVDRVVRAARALATDPASPVEEVPGTGRDREACVDLLMNRGLQPGVESMRLAELRRWVVHDGLGAPTAMYRCPDLETDDGMSGTDPLRV
jgi:hypothetical protein